MRQFLNFSNMTAFSRVVHGREECGAGSRAGQTGLGADVGWAARIRNADPSLARARAVAGARADHDSVKAGQLSCGIESLEIRLNRDEQRLNNRLDRLEQRLPSWLHRALKWLREPQAAWLRIPLGVVLILGGLFSILPLLGAWMLPFGLILLAQDIPFLRRPLRRALIWCERCWIRWKRRRCKQS